MKHVALTLIALSVSGCSTLGLFGGSQSTDLNPISTDVGGLETPKLTPWTYENTTNGLICMKPSEHQILMMNMAQMNVYSAGLKDRLEVIQKESDK